MPWLGIIFIAFLVSVYFFYFTKPPNNYRSEQKENVTANNPYMVRSYGKDPNSKFWQSWGKGVSLDQAKKNLAFTLRLPSGKQETSLGKLKAVVIEGTPSQTEKSRVTVLFYSSGVRVMQSFLPKNEVPPTKLSDYKNSATFKQLKRDFKSVNVNGVEGIAGAPGAFKNSYGVIERKPGIVTWYKKPLLYTVYGDGYIPLSQLIKIARLF